MKTLFVLLALTCAFAAVAAQKFEYEDAPKNCPKIKILNTMKMTPKRKAKRTFLGQYVKVTNRMLFGGGYGYDKYSGAVYYWTKLVGFGDRMIIFQRLRPSDPQNGAYFGLNLNYGEGILAVGSPFWKSNGFQSGAAYVFKAQSSGRFTQVAKLVPKDVHPGAYFGYSIIVASGNRIIVGSRRADNDKTGAKFVGAFYVWKKTKNGKYKVIQKERGPGSFSQFSDEIRAEKDILLVSAPRWKDTKGTAYVYKVKSDGTYRRIQELVPQLPDGVQLKIESHIGEGLALTWTTKWIAVGGERARSYQGKSGAVYLWKRNGDKYEFYQHLFPHEGGPNQRYGQRVDIVDNMVVVGAWTRWISGGQKGVVYLYHKCLDGKFYFRKLLRLRKGTKRDEYGKVVDANRNFIAVGAPKHDESGKRSGNEGAVFLYKYRIECQGKCPSV
mmetsp:Transcript_318/g.1048  ORF Transcript_318/g.1048 Transcript_318/m.1048 type:complete len:441 (+) Transcript_318:96-1418(+)|eukprot:CAMPEP_0198737600 /NCGR_PEP_ID=MMETSP1475-20131203/67949_1 /TAXON_ID= ORGANISM="Unidentified sp., Strain CCMP1999" /NCGR_SAMPLE_ID=MMETSP1475 /ASSEMBLY_ACC=CAM_ASM_001111 /LENGTH=440 /DNA_ID=CAMNT_0044501469 /DNA_START=85 /DNA_END=1407 /DNA_ORIENTATION=+